MTDRIKDLNEFERNLIKREKELAKREQELLKNEKKIDSLIQENKFLIELYNNGLNKLTFMKTVTEPTTHKSDHPKINKDLYNKKFSILSNIDDYINYEKIHTKISTFLNYCKDKNNIIQFADEEAIKTKLEMLFDDILNICNLDLEISNGSVGINFGETISSSKTKKPKKTQRPDYWILIKNDYRAKTAGEIKPPKTEDENCIDAIKEDETIGQIYDYMMSQKHFYNQKYVFGILTTLDEWKFCWLPDTDECAKNDFLLPDTYISNYTNNPREIHSTKIYHHTDKNLIKIILSLIIKSYYSACYPVAIFSEKRTYVRLTKTNWKWTQYKDDFLNKLNKHVTLNLYQSNKVGFTVLKYFKGGHYSKVRLAISDDGNFVVLKEFVDEVDDEIIDNELMCWKYGNQIRNVYKEIICNKRSLVMPLVFNIHKDDKNKKLYIPLDLKIWSVEQNAIPDILPEKLNIWNEELKYHVNLSFEYILETAIDKLARSGIIHKDLEIRHFALYPIIENNNIINLEPILIDFDHIEMNKTYEEAYNYMNNIVNKILKIYKNYSFEYDV